MIAYFGNSSGNLLADRRYELALRLAEAGDYKASIDLLLQCMDLAPEWPPIFFHLGESFRQAGKPEGAQHAFEDYLTLDPEDKMGAGIKLALLGLAPEPSAISTAYVRSLFDQYAPKFEKSLVENLSYIGPELIFQAVTALHDSSPFGHALDLGCGTGLAAQKFDGRAQSFTGVDLAGRMIDIAREKNIYKSLHVGDMRAFLEETSEKYDLVLCADVLIYTGEVEHLFSLVSAHMLESALFAFTVQTAEDGTYRLGQDHRFAHSRVYIEHCAKAAGLNIRSCTDCNLRMDNGTPVNAMVIVCQKIPV